ncbi:MAG: copper amine oxidase N-terminal domain-containing protein [Anaerovoracaceae bacterium]
MKKKNNILGILLTITLCFTAVVPVCADTAKTIKTTAYCRPNFTIEVDGMVQIFKDVNEKRVYPIVYQGSTYLPVRAVSALMDEDVEWDNYSKTVYIGKTLSNPNKSKAKKDTESRKSLETVEKEAYQAPDEKGGLVKVYIRPDINIMYDFNMKVFNDEDGKTVYPIIYEGSTYLPLRAVSELMNREIQWDNETKTIIIEKPEEEQPKQDEGQKDDENLENRLVTAENSRLLVREFDKAVELYDVATDKILNIQKTTDAAMKLLIAEGVSEDVKLAQEQAHYVRNMSTEGFTEEQIEAKDALDAFVEISEYYILVLENIAVLAANEQDYSMLAETFFNFAMDTQTKMDAARAIIENLPQ